MGGKPTVEDLADDLVAVARDRSALKALAEERGELLADCARMARGLDVDGERRERALSIMGPILARAEKTCGRPATVDANDAMDVIAKLTGVRVLEIPALTPPAHKP